MQNISNRKTNTKNLITYSVFDLIHLEKSFINPKSALLILLGTIIISLFLPWTQFLQTKGYLTTLKPDDRPQTINSALPGRIEKWYVKEGDFVRKGDTIVKISEIKSEYFDPMLVERTSEQIQAKESSKVSYVNKIEALENQIVALRENYKLKLQQNVNKIKQSELKVFADSIDLETAHNNLNIAKIQLERFEQLFQQGLKSKTDMESRNVKYRDMIAKEASSNSKLLISRNELINAKIELNSIRADYEEKIAKADSDKRSAESSFYDNESTISKMNNDLDNYKIRRQNLYITAPQNVYILKALSKGVGETIKDGEAIVTVMPANAELAVEFYVEPFDIPLVKLEEKGKLLFNGYPTIFVPGWPELSVGTFDAEIAAIDQSISENGKYRVLLKEVKGQNPWPKSLKFGLGTEGVILLNDVPIWYEIWRQINGLPADFYAGESAKPKKEDDKK